MTLQEVKRNMRKKVLYQPLECEYLLTACIMRLDKNGSYFYQAELQDLRSPYSVLICRLEDIAQC